MEQINYLQLVEVHQLIQRKLLKLFDVHLEVQ